MAERSGFFTALPIYEGEKIVGYDITYNAEDYSDALAAIVGSGVTRGILNELVVSSNGGMNLKVETGYAFILGRWYKNDSIHTSFAVPTAPQGSLKRIDRVVLKLDKNVSNRKIRLAYKTGVAAATPTAPTLQRDNTIYELSLATINVSSNATAISNNDIVDDRTNDELCGWVTTPIGYEDFFKTFDNQFNAWFEEKKNTLSSVTLFKQYHQRITTTSLTTLIEFNIPQYDPTGVDIIDVFINGINKVKNIDYTVNSNTQTSLTFVDELIAGTLVDIYVYKSIDGTGLGSVSDEITELQNEVATFKNIGEYIYICNGINDNKNLSDIAQEFWTTAPENSTLTINVYGTFGVTAPYGGDGSSISRYRWFSLGTTNASSNKRVIFDFLNCSLINLMLQPSSDTHYIVFDNTNFSIKNANIRVSRPNAPTVGSCVVFSSTTGRVIAENCKFNISGSLINRIAYSGTFINCIGQVSHSYSGGVTACFEPSNNCLLRIENGEYTATNTYSSISYNDAVVYIPSSAPNAVVITNGVNCPNITGSAYSFYCEAGYGAFNDTISTLPYVKSSNQNLRGYYPLNLSNRG